MMNNKDKPMWNNVYINEMDNQYLINAIRYIERKAKNGIKIKYGGIDADGPYYDEKISNDPSSFHEYPHLIREMEKRGLKLKEPTK